MLDIRKRESWLLPSNLIHFLPPPLDLPWSSPALDVMDDPAPRKSAAGVCQSRRPHKNSPQGPTSFDLREALITSEPQLAQPIFILRALSNSSYPAPHPYLHVSWLLRALYLWGLCHLSEVKVVGDVFECADPLVSVVGHGALLTLVGKLWSEWTKKMLFNNHGPSPCSPYNSPGIRL